MSEKIGEGLVRIGAMDQEQMNEVLRRQSVGDDRGVNRPVSCAIYQAKTGGKPVSIDLWPTGRIAV